MRSKLNYVFIITTRIKLQTMILFRVYLHVPLNDVTNRYLLFRCIFMKLPEVEIVDRERKE